MNNCIILFTMVFMHIIFDYNLQGILAQFKQRSFWKENYPDPVYKYDYLICLFEHSFMWAFGIMIPLFVYSIYTGSGITYHMITALIVNTIIHAIVDHMKCNVHMINLVQDQLIHICQIMITAVIILF